MTAQWRRLKRELMADKKKATILATTAALGLLLWGRLLLQGAPRTATADDQKAKQAAAALIAPAPAVPSDDEPAQPQREVQLADRVQRDLFAIRSNLFPRFSEGPDSTWPGAKSGSFPTDESERRRLAVLNEARELRLEGTLLGSIPRARINGRLIRIGESVQGFELVEIRSRELVLRKDGLVVVLEM